VLRFLLVMTLTMTVTCEEHGEDDVNAADVDDDWCVYRGIPGCHLLSVPAWMQ